MKKNILYSLALSLILSQNIFALECTRDAKYNLNVVAKSKITESSYSELINKYQKTPAQEEELIVKVGEGATPLEKIIPKLKLLGFETVDQVPPARLLLTRG